MKIQSSRLPALFLAAFALLASPALRAAATYATPYAFSTLTGVSSIGSNDGPGAAARFYGPSGLACDAAGNLYVSDESNNTIRKITPAGVVSTLAGTSGVRGSSDGTGPDAQFINPVGIAVDATGNVFVADKINLIVRKISPAGVVTTIAGAPGDRGTADGSRNVARLFITGGAALDRAGNLFVAEWVNNTIRKIAPDGTVTTIAGQPGVYGTADGVGTAATFMFPYALAFDSQQNLWVGDLIGSLRKIAPDGTVTTVIPSSAGYLGIGCLAIDSTDAIYFATSSAIRRRAPDGTITLIAGAASAVGSADGPAATARFNYPSGLAFDRAGNLFVADRNNNNVRKIAPDGTVSTLAGLAPEYATGATDGALTAARFSALGQIAAAPTGELYVADTVNSTIRKISRDGAVTTFAGKAGQRGNVDGTGEQARFDSPYGIALASDGNLYVSDASANTIRKVTAAGVVTTLAGSALGLPGAVDGTGSAARFNYPAGLVVGLDANLYVADRLNHTLRCITPAGVVTTFAGSSGSPGNVDDFGAAARFDTPEGLAQDAAGNFYVSHSVRHGSIRKITPAAKVITLAGGAGGEASAVDGMGTAARFNQPKALAVDASGNVFVADGENHVIRKVTPDGVVTTLAGLAEAAGSADGMGRKSRFLSPPGLSLDRDGAIYVTSGTTIRKGLLAAAPRITTHPANAIVNAGASAQLSVVAAATPEPTYQWRLNGTVIVGATASSLTVSAARTADAGDYTVVVTNELGSITSTPATLTVNTPTTTPAPAPSSGGGGGGGGAPSIWFAAAIAALAWIRRFR